MAQTAVAWCTPGTAAISRTTAEPSGDPAPVLMTALAPVLCQDAAISPRPMPSLTVPAKLARPSASTSANAGSIAKGRAAPENATKPVALVPRADRASRPRTASGYSRSMTRTTGITTSTGAALRYRLMPPLAGRPWSRSTTTPATQAAHAVSSATRRRHPTRIRRLPAVVIRAGRRAGPDREPTCETRLGWACERRRRCRHTAISGGPASAVATAIPASHQPSAGTVVPPGTRATARPAPSSAPGTAATRAPRPVTAASCRTDPPRARSTPSSPSRRATIIRPASAITAAPVTVKLTNSSRSTVCTADWVAMNAARSAISGEVTVTVPADG